MVIRVKCFVCDATRIITNDHALGSAACYRRDARWFRNNNSWIIRVHSCSFVFKKKKQKVPKGRRSLHSVLSSLRDSLVCRRFIRGRNLSLHFVQTVRSLRTKSPKPSDNLSEAFGQTVRRLRTFLGQLFIHISLRHFRLSPRPCV